MFWVVQENLYNEEGIRSLLNQLDRRGISHHEVKFLPFLRRLVPADLDINTIDDVENYPEPDIPTGDQLVMVIGAIALARLASERNWIPGSFINDNFHAKAWEKGFGPENLLNGDAVYTTLQKFKAFVDSREPSSLSNSFFVRPCNDDKAWTGCLVKGEEAKTWTSERCREAQESGRFSEDIEIAVSSPKQIFGEFRFFIVDGVVVTGSRYRMGPMVVYNQDIPVEVLDFAQQMVSQWQPARAFVIDIAETQEGPKIIEVNNFNSAGFYSCDVGKIIDAVESMIF